jgi:hypothetical protein
MRAIYPFPVGVPAGREAPDGRVAKPRDGLVVKPTDGRVVKPADGRVVKPPDGRVALTAGNSARYPS